MLFEHLAEGGVGLENVGAIGEEEESLVLADGEVLADDGLHVAHAEVLRHHELRVLQLVHALLVSCSLDYQWQLGRVLLSSSQGILASFL